MDWYPWYPDLYEADTIHLTAAQDGVYRRLIDWYMRKRQPPPSHSQAIANISRISLEEWLSMEPVLMPFFKEENGFLRHKRCDIELQRQDRRSNALSELGKKGAEKRKENRILQATALATVKRRHKQRTVQDSTGQDKKNLSVKPNGVDLQFEQWWELVPRKIAKGAARRAFLMALKKVNFGVLEQGIRTYAQKARDMEPRFICHPATWLNGERWSDTEPVTETPERTYEQFDTDIPAGGDKDELPKR